MCPCCRIIFGIENERERCVSGQRGTDSAAITSRPHEWLMSVHGDFTPFPYTLSVPCVSRVLLDLLRERRTPENARLVLLRWLLKSKDVAWWWRWWWHWLVGKRRVKDSLASWLLSLTVLENTHFRRKCAEAL